MAVLDKAHALDQYIPQTRVALAFETLHADLQVYYIPKLTVAATLKYSKKE